MPGATQRRVRRTMLDAGGYWRPLAAVARLLEELGELSELLAAPQPAQPGVSAELADLWIITAALADQYLAELPEPGAGAAGIAEPAAARAPGGGPAPARGVGDAAEKAETLEALAQAVAAAGEIARVVNYYDGPKTPRTLAALPSLGGAVASFHLRLALLAARLGVELAAAVDAKLGVIRATDMQRFQRERSDPCTAPVLDRLRDAAPDTAALRLWGAPDTDADRALRSFLRACGPERLDAFVVEQERLQRLDTAQLEIERRAGFALLRPRGGAGRGDGPA